MNVIYGIALCGLVLLLFILVKNMNWKVETGNWIVLEGIAKEHSEVRRIAVYLEQHNIPAKVELLKQSKTVQLFYSKKMPAIIKVKSEDYQQATSIVAQYVTEQQNR